MVNGSVAGGYYGFFKAWGAMPVGIFHSIIQEQKTMRIKFFYGWVIVGISFLIMSVVYAIWYSFPLLYVYILDEFGWTRAATALIFSVGSVVYGIGSAIGGIMLDRFGPRKTFTFATLLMVIGLIGCNRGRELWHFFWFWGGFASFGICAAGFVPCVALIANWFAKKRATAIGIAQAGGRESFIMIPLIQALILALGWRDTYLVLAAAAAVLIIIPSQFLRHSPKDMGLLPDGGAVTEELEKSMDSRADRAIVNKEWSTTDWTLPRAIKEYRFWGLFSLMIAIGTSYGIVMTHQIAFMIGIGFTAMFASFILLIYGIFSMSGRLCGFFSDMVGRETAYTIGGVGIILAYLLLIFIPDDSWVWMLYFYAICFGFFSGLNSPTYGAAAADIFLGRHFGSIFGFFNIGYGLGSAIGAWVGGYLFDITGSYDYAFALAIIVTGFASIFMWISSPRKIRVVERKVPL